MRSSIIGVATALIIMVTFYIICAIQVNSTLYTETSHSINEALYQTEMRLWENYENYDSDDDVLSELNTNLRKFLPSGREAVVRVYGVDYARGLLDVGVRVDYTSVHGAEKYVYARRTMIFEGTPPTE